MIARLVDLLLAIAIALDTARKRIAARRDTPGAGGARHDTDRRDPTPPAPDYATLSPAPATPPSWEATVADQADIMGKVRDVWTAQSIAATAIHHAHVHGLYVQAWPKGEA